MSRTTSYAQLLKSISVMGSASAVSIVFGTLRAKLIAVLVGAEGVGLVSLFQFVQTGATTIGGLGLGTAGAKEIANASHDRIALQPLVSSLHLASVLLASISFLAIFFSRDFLATQLLGEPGLSAQTGWLGVGVSASIIVTVQGAIFSGLRRLADIAVISVVGTAVGTILSVSVIWVAGKDALVTAVVIIPVASCLVSTFLLVRSKLHHPTFHFSQSLERLHAIGTLGFAVTLAAAVQQVGQLSLRVQIRDELGLVNLGYFQAAWTISSMYIGVALASLSSDYYPRLSARSNDGLDVAPVINEQIQVSLLVCGPVLVVLSGAAPWILMFLYSTEFSVADSALRWQIAGDALRIVGWPLGFLALAVGDGRKFFLAELLFISALLGSSTFLLPVLGLSGPCMAYFGAYGLYVSIAMMYASLSKGFSLDRRSKKYLLALSFSLLVVALASLYTREMALICSLVLGSILLVQAAHAFRLRS